MKMADIVQDIAEKLNNSRPLLVTFSVTAFPGGTPRVCDLRVTSSSGKFGYEKTFNIWAVAMAKAETDDYIDSINSFCDRVLESYDASWALWTTELESVGGDS